MSTRLLTEAHLTIISPFARYIYRVSEQEVVGDASTDHGAFSARLTELPTLSALDASQSLLRLSGRTRFSIRDGDIAFRFQSS